MVLAGRRSNCVQRKRAMAGNGRSIHIFAPVIRAFNTRHGMETGATWASRYVGLEVQQDASEFLEFVIEHLHDEWQMLLQQNTNDRGRPVKPPSQPSTSQVHSAQSTVCFRSFEHD